MVSPIQWPPSRPPKHLIFQFLPHLSAAAPHLARPGKSMPQLCVAAPTTHPVRLLVLVSQNQPAASIFLSKNPAPASPNQHLHRPTIKLTISALHRLPPALSSSATCPPFLTAPCPFSRSIYRHLSSSFISSRHRPSVLIFTLATFPAHRRPLSLSFFFSCALSPHLLLPFLRYFLLPLVSPLSRLLEPAQEDRCLLRVGRVMPATATNRCPICVLGLYRYSTLDFPMCLAYSSLFPSIQSFPLVLGFRSSTFIRSGCCFYFIGLLIWISF